MSAMFRPLILRRPRALVEPSAVALGARRERGDALDESPDVRLQRVDVLGQHRLLELRDEALVRDVDAGDLDLRWLLVEEVLTFGLRVLLDWLVPIEEPGLTELPGCPAVGGVARHRDGALVQRLGLVEHLAQIDVRNGAAAFAVRAHSAVVDLIADNLLLPCRRRHDAAGGARGDVERERDRRADEGLAQPAEQDAQQRIGVCDRADGRSHVGTHPLLVDDDRRRRARRGGRRPAAAVWP